MSNIFWTIVLKIPRHLFIRSYFSRLTRERRKKTTESEAETRRIKKKVKNNEGSQSEAEEDEEEDDDDDNNNDTEFESVLADAQTHELLDHAIAVLDDILKQQERN